MRARWHFLHWLWITAIGIALIASLEFPAASIAADDLPEPLCWRQLAFSIPFKVAPAESPEQQPAEVRLYVSGNSGAKWDLAKSVSPQERSFTFRAAQDGEYWFQIRTVDRQGRVAPEVGGRPELRVIVDTMPPRLDLTASRGEAGEVKATWQAVDPLLYSDTLKIEYQTTSGAWRAVAVDRPPGGQNRGTSSGSLTWFPPDAPSGSVAVRAEISDRAGNVTSSQAQADPPGGPGIKPKPELTARNSPAPTSQENQRWMSTPNSGSPLPNSAPTPSSSVPSYTLPGYTLPSSAPLKTANSPGQQSSTMASATPSRQLPAGPGGTAWHSDTASTLPLGRNPIPSDDSTGPSFANAPRTYSSDVGRPSPSRYGDIAGRTVENVNPPIRNQVIPESNQNQFTGPGPTDSAQNLQPRNPSLSIPASAKPQSSDANASIGQTGDSFGSNNMLPAGQRPLMVNSRSFDLEYEVDGVGPAGIAKVELWGTRDGGHNWASYGVDSDNRSPIRANVDGEGLYGFRIVVQSGNGLGGLPPHSGDAPDLWVMVDMTKPNVRLIDATAGEGQSSGELLIRWEANDASLAVRPITLQFSDRPGGPWSIMAAGLENTGQYAWRPDSRAPDRIYLRIEARDAAGNTGLFEGAEPVPLQRIRPEGRIRGVRPASDTALGPQVYDFSR